MHLAYDPATRAYSAPLGRGLFARQSFPSGTLVAQFRGSLIDPITAQSRQVAGRGGYMVRLNDQFILDCYDQAHNDSCRASMANDPRRTRHSIRHTNGTGNVRLVIGRLPGRGVRFSLNTITAVQAGEELMLNYEDDFIFPVAAPPTPPGPLPPRRRARKAKPLEGPTAVTAPPAAS